MKSRRPLESVTAAIDDLVGTVRRERGALNPSVRIYDKNGNAELLSSDSEASKKLIEMARKLVAKPPE